ncbi:MAG: hypothetical protein H6R01_2081 [Burkholderiaceae bacterium]|nr:hypothetical protein [Burkholderiaceae bacterium]
MAALMPAVMRMASIQKDCAAVLPALFDKCAVQRFESGQLVLSAPNAALATRLKQQLPKLQQALNQAGWQVSAIRTKVQVPENKVKFVPREKPPVPPQAIAALAALGEALENSSSNESLKAALARMVARHS